MEDHAQAKGVEVELVDLRGHALVVFPHLGDGRLRQGPVYDTDVHAGLLEDVPLLEDAGQTAAAVWPCPRVLAEALAVDLLQRKDDLLLLLAYELLHAQAHWGVVCDFLLPFGTFVEFGQGARIEFGGVLDGLDDGLESIGLR